MDTKNVYSPYGYHLPIQGVIAFNGEKPDLITGHYHLGNGHRAYSPVLMRFMSADSLSPFAQGGLNAYAYCIGDPVNYQDPSGRNRWLAVLRKLQGVKKPVIDKPTYSKTFGFHATDGWNRDSLVRDGPQRGHSREGRQSLGEAVYFRKNKAGVKRYFDQAIDGVVLEGRVQDGLSLTPGIGYRSDGRIVAIQPAGYPYVKMFEAGLPDTADIDLPATGTFAKIDISRGAEAPSAELVKKVKGTRTSQ